MFQDTPDGQTHFYGDGCSPEHVQPNKETLTPTKSWDEELREQFRQDCKKKYLLGVGVYNRIVDNVAAWWIAKIQEARNEERERGNKEIAGAIEMSKHGWIEQGRMEERERILNHPLMEEEDESPSNANPFWSERKAENSLRRELKKVITKE